MAVVNTAAVDPVFWLHHSEIDRLWEVWRAMCGGRANPTDATWLTKSYTFFDEFGNPVTLTGSQVVEISSQLNYKYDDLPPFAGCPASRPVLLGRETLITKETAVQLNGRKQKAEFAGEASNQIDSFIRRNNRNNFEFSNRQITERVSISFEGLTIQQMPEGVVEVYLNLPPGQTPDYRSNNFVGLLDLFSAEHHNNHHLTEMQGDEIELDATKAVQALRLNANSLRNATVSFYVRGATLNRVEAGTNAQFSIRRIKFSVDRFSN
jgi:tyrosinase